MATKKPRKNGVNQMSKHELNRRIKKEMEKELLLTTRQTVDGYSAALAYCLHNKLGFGTKRAKRFLKYVNELFDSINSGYVSLEDVQKDVEERLKIKIS